MSTIVCRSILVEPSSLSLKLNPPIQPPQCIDPIQTGWSSIEALSNASSLHLGVYVHPLDKRSTSTMLSERSLEMCTENLGSETGTDTTEDDIFSIMSLDSEGEELMTSIAPRDYPRVTITTTTKPRHKKMGSSSCRKAGYESLPPPLTTTIRVQPHRESGRLVMMAVAASPRRPSILAERSNGRLTMSLMEEFFEEDEDEEDDEEDEEYEEKESVKEVGIPKTRAGNEEDTDGNNKEVGDKFGINGEFQRLSRCNEGGRGSRRFINWETFWVAT